jgi:hypothetical protein
MLCPYQSLYRVSVTRNEQPLNLKEFQDEQILFRLVTAILLGTLVLSACGSSATAPERPPLVVEYSTWWGDYTLGVVQELGLFEKYGVKVEPVYYEVYSDSFPDMATGKIDAGLFGMGEAITVSDQTKRTMVAIYNLPVDQLQADDQLKIFTLTETSSLFQPNADGSPGFAMDAAMKTGDYLLQKAIIARVPDYSTFLDLSYLK